MNDQKIIHTMADLMAIAEMEQNGRVSYFRGQSQDWPLLPGIARDRESAAFSDFLRREVSYITELRTALFGDSERADECNEWIVATIAQHYRIPTRLLDWSESPLVALFFAVESHDDYNGVVWVFRDKSAVRMKGAYFYGEKGGRNALSLQYPRIFRAHRDWEKGNISVPIPRLIAQRGALSCQPDMMKTFDQNNFKDDQNIDRYIICKNRKSYFREKLMDFGIHRGALFPDHIRVSGNNYKDITRICTELYCKIHNQK